MQRLRNPGASLFGRISGPQLKRKALNSWAAVQDTYFSTKDTFERHKVVFTIGTSVASVATAFVGYSLRHLHDTKVDRRLESIENVLKDNHHNLEQSDIKKIVNSGRSNTAACIATAGTTLVIGYVLGWRGGRSYANKKFREEQLKKLGQLKPKKWQLLGRIKPKGWQFQFLRRPLRVPGSVTKAPEKRLQDTTINTHNTGEINHGSIL